METRMGRPESGFMVEPHVTCLTAKASPLMNTATILHAVNRSAGKLPKLIALVAATTAWVPSARAEFCVVPNAGGTAELPPVNCEYILPEESLTIVDGLPAGTTIEIDAVLKDFFGVVAGAGGTLGGERETYDATLEMPMQGTGVLAVFNRFIPMQVSNISDSAPRTPGDVVQDFDRDMFSMAGEILGDPDFTMLRIMAGTAHGLPSPGHTTLTRLGPPGSDFNVDSFFDVAYRIEFQGAPGSVLEGFGGTTTGTARFQLGMPVPEPATGNLAVVGLAMLGGCLWRRRF